MSKKNYTQIGSDFENEVREFLQKMDFNDIKGGVDFRIGGKQIDVGL